MSLVDESFGGYVERRRFETSIAQRNQRWMFLACLLAVYLWPFYLLGMAVFPTPLTCLGIALSGVGLYVGGVYLVSSDRWFDARDLKRSSIWTCVKETVSVQHLLVVGMVWLGSTLWGEVVAPLLSRQVPQLLLGIVLSSVLAGGHFERTLRLWPLEVSQLWQDYLADVRGILRTYYQQLEDSRHSLRRYGGVNDDLCLETLEARQLLQDFTGPMGLDAVSEAMIGYVSRLEDSQHCLSDLLDRLEMGSMGLESVLLQVETYLDIQSQTAHYLDSVEVLGDLYLQPIVQLSGELETVVEGIAGVSKELDGWQQSFAYA